jgi:hypothetical protein
MKEHPIIFNSEMVRAILDGRKSQTRRVIKAPVLYLDCFQAKVRPPTTIKQGKDGVWYFSWYGDTAGGFGLKCPYGGIGDRLWVRETVRACEDSNGWDGVYYLADAEFRVIENTPEAGERWGELYNYRKKKGAKVPSIHMPRWASRITLEVKRVWVEWVQEITVDDVYAEGLERQETDFEELNCGERFRRLWDSINAKRGFGWDENPWVWCVEFEVAT